MPVKLFHVDGIGEIRIHKRHRTKRVSLKVMGDHIIVTQPAWLPYSNGLDFAISHSAWIDKQKQTQPHFYPQPDSAIGKKHVLRYQPYSDLKSKITDDELIIYVPPHQHIHSPAVLELTKKAIKKTLKDEADEILGGRLEALALKYGYIYNQVHFKSMRTRWGSCTNRHDIALNISLLLLPYELMDYVLLHELVHTKHLNHSKEFWAELAAIMPDYKLRRKNLRIVQHSTMALQ